MLFYVFALIFTVFILFFVVMLFNQISSVNLSNLFNLFTLFLSYITLFSIIFYLIIITSDSASSIAFKMISVWLLFCVILPGGIHQYASMKYPQII